MKVMFVAAFIGVALSGVAVSPESKRDNVESRLVKKLESAKPVSLKATPVSNWRLYFIKTEKGEPIKLENGKYECRKPANYNVVNLIDYYTCKNAEIPTCYGAVIAVNTGGSGCFIYLVLFNNGISVAHKFLGDRIRIKSVYFHDGQLLAEYFVRTKGQAMTDIPTQAKVEKIKVNSNLSKDK